MRLPISIELLREMLHLPEDSRITNIEFRQYGPGQLVTTACLTIEGDGIADGEGDAIVYTREAREGDRVVDRVELCERKWNVFEEVRDGE